MEKTIVLVLPCLYAPLFDSPKNTIIQRYCYPTKVWTKVIYHQEFEYEVILYRNHFFVKNIVWKHFRFFKKKRNLYFFMLKPNMRLILYRNEFFKCKLPFLRKITSVKLTPDSTFFCRDSKRENRQFIYSHTFWDTMEVQQMNTNSIYKHLEIWLTATYKIVQSLRDLKCETRWRRKQLSSKPQNTSWDFRRLHRYLCKFMKRKDATNPNPWVCSPRIWIWFYIQIWFGFGFGFGFVFIKMCLDLDLFPLI